jgi:phage shock protein PspC (stress-responsive transcriptional regulator)
MENEKIDNMSQTSNSQSSQETSTSQQSGNGQASMPMRRPRRMLYRSPTDKLIGGVCGGIAEYLDWNPVLIRVLWVVITFATWGGGILAYLLLALFLPTGNNTVGQMRPPALELSSKGITWAAGLLMGLGGLWLLANVGILPGIWRAFWTVVGVLFWPTLLIGAGYLLLRANSSRDLDQEVTGAARKFKHVVGEKMPSGDQVKTGFEAARASMPLQRSTTDRMFMGVCGGIAEKTGIDANLIRLLWAAFAIGTLGLGALIYVGVGLFLPEAPAFQANGSGTYGQSMKDIAIVDASGEKTS